MTKSDANIRGRVAKAFQVICSCVWWVVLILIATLMINIIGAKMKGRVPSVFGYSVLNIITGSMGEQMPVGSYILVKKVEPEQIKENDIICFYSTEPEIYGMPNTHRVVEPPIVKDGRIEFVTKGDASDRPDEYNALGENLIGLYVERIDWLEDLSDFFESGAIFAIILALQVGIVVLIVFSTAKLKKSAEETDKSEAADEDAQINNATTDFEASEPQSDNGKSDGTDLSRR